MIKDGGPVTIKDNEPVEIFLQERLDRLFMQITTVRLLEKDLFPAETHFVIGPEHKWPYPDFRQAASDREFRQGNQVVSLKAFFPGDYWIYGQTYTRDNIKDGHRPTGSSEGKFIYIPTFSPNFQPSPIEVGEFNLIGIHEAAHRVDDRNNAGAYEVLHRDLKTAEPHSLEYMSILRKLKTRSELGAWKLVLDFFQKIQGKGVNIFSGTNNQLRAIILDGLRSQQQFLAVRLPQD